MSVGKRQAPRQGASRLKSTLGGRILFGFEREEGDDRRSPCLGGVRVFDPLLGGAAACGIGASSPRCGCHASLPRVRKVWCLGCSGGRIGKALWHAGQAQLSASCREVDKAGRKRRNPPPNKACSRRLRLSRRLLAQRRREKTKTERRGKRRARRAAAEATVRKSHQQE